ncbi:winged helix-turn-helix transcriptional regulator [Streptomyces oryzae]|uniref:Winged helix-turn-helix transcriptional regulator n=1 Tax=Streptomyces oryzae TaxID=1434886 RepID=A0ABS3XMF5_9ACTN|nr:winged helix-turn-helix domain-containing protein [Streptomyces oryzae]MBO8196589.1 winged helix-turn-helix transcriptional regulator [Streptomyces oryzae]
MRIHFTVADLARVRLAAAPSPLAVTSLSAWRLRHDTGGPPALDLWRRTVHLARRSAPGPAAPLLGGLAAGAPSHPVPRLLRPHSALPTLAEELERLLSTPRAELRADLEYVATHRRLPSWTHALADGSPSALRGLAGAVRAQHSVAIEPYWRGLYAAIRADQAERTRQWHEGGVELVLDNLHPAGRWRPPVLEFPHAQGPDYHLGGRGLLLAPAAFTAYVPCDPGEPQPTFYYQAVEHPLAGALNGPHAALATLLGHSRAAVLEAIAEGVSTSRLARRTGLAPASASEHATVLRRAGLVSTRRSGRTAHHTLTPLGAQLLLHTAADESSAGRSVTARASGC